MPDVSFVFTNPRHHLDMMAPVARTLRARGLECQLVSLAELRGFDTPRDLDLPVRAAIPFNVRRSPKVGASMGNARHGGGVRALARRAMSEILVPVVRRLIGNSRVIVIPNDAAFPYAQLLASVRDTPVVLMQEGIRFAMPNGDGYGTGGATMTCAWGEGSREFFIGRGAPADRIVVTGSPRHDGLNPSAWSEQGHDLLARLGLRDRPLALLSNPIEHQGYGTESDKLAMFERFLDEAEPVLRDRNISLVVKNHAFEDPSAFARTAAQSRAADRVHVDAGSPLFAALAVAAGAVVLTSTAGVEALMFGVPLGALQLPGNGFGFEYVERGAAVGLRSGAIATGLAELLDQGEARRPAADRLIEHHLHDRGAATENVAAVIAKLIGR